MTQLVCTYFYKNSLIDNINYYPCTTFSFVISITIYIINEMRKIRISKMSKKFQVD